MSHRTRAFEIKCATAVSLARNLPLLFIARDFLRMVARFMGAVGQRRKEGRREGEGDWRRTATASE